MIASTFMIEEQRTTSADDSSSGEERFREGTGRF